MTPFILGSAWPITNPTALPRMSSISSSFGEVLARRLPSFVSNTSNARVRVETVTLNASKIGLLLSRGDILALMPPFTILRYRRQVVVS
jgi:hypothetical protein